MRVRQGNFEVILFTNVKSISGGMNPNQGTIVNLKYVASLFSLLRAVYKTNLKLENGDQKIKNIESEICYHLSPSKNVREFSKISHIDADTREVAVILHNSIENAESFLSGIEGDETDCTLFDTLLTDEKIQFLINYLRLSTEELSLSNFEDAVAMKLAIKDV
jgi:hypothetical protein